MRSIVRRACWRHLLPQVLQPTVGAGIGFAQQVAPGIGPTVPNVGRLVPLTPTIGPNVGPLGTGRAWSDGADRAATDRRGRRYDELAPTSTTATPTTTTTPTNTPRLPGTTSTNAGANPNHNIEPRTPGSSGGGAGESQYSFGSNPNCSSYSSFEGFGGRPCRQKSRRTVAQSKDGGESQQTKNAGEEGDREGWRDRGCCG